MDLVLLRLRAEGGIEPWAYLGALQYATNTTNGNQQQYPWWPISMFCTLHPPVLTTGDLGPPLLCPWCL